MESNETKIDHRVPFARFAKPGRLPIDIALRRLCHIVIDAAGMILHLVAGLIRAAATIPGATWRTRVNENVPGPEDCFGVCPRCHLGPIRRDIGPTSFMCCDDCRVYWSVGTILTSDEAAGTPWLLSQYEEVGAPFV